MTMAASLDKSIQPVCPIYGVSIGKMADKSTWRIQFMESATPSQKLAAQAVLAAFDPNAAEPETQKKT